MSERHMAIPEHIDPEDILGPEPTWQHCPQCDAMTSRVPCWECVRLAANNADAAREAATAMSSIPPRYAWAHLRASELAGRVRPAWTSYVGPIPLPALTPRILAAPRVLLIGGAGAGKTSLATACLRERMPHAMFVSALKLGTARIQSRAGSGEAALVSACLDARLLLIDDVGRESQTSTNALPDVVFERHALDRPTWITTGLRRPQLTGLYGDGIVRRLYEDALVVYLTTKVPTREDR